MEELRSRDRDHYGSVIPRHQERQESDGVAEIAPYLHGGVRNWTGDRD